MHLAELSVYDVQEGHTKLLLHMKNFDMHYPVCVFIVPYFCCLGGRHQYMTTLR